MRAAVWHARNDVRVEEVPEPGPAGPHEVVLRIEACGICGTDLEEYRAGPILIPVDEPNLLTGRKAPIVLGHEFAGEVVEIGSGVTSLRLGDRVAADVLITCGTCYWCQRHQVTLCDQMAALGLSGDGGLAEYCKVPASMCVKLPDNLSFELGAIAEPLAVAVHAVRKSRLAIGETVAIFGGGTIGLFCLQVALNAGASDVYLVEPLSGRRDLAVQLGATAAVDPRNTSVTTWLRDANGIGPDVVIEASGAPSAGPAAIEAARKGGRVVLVGIPVAPTTLDFLSIVTTEKEVIGSLSHVYDEDFVTAIQLLSNGRVQGEPLISHRISLNDLISGGFERLETHGAETLKIIVHPGERASAAV